MAELKLGSRQAFPHLQDQCYLAHAAVAPLALPVSESLQAYIRLLEAKGFEAVGETLAMRERLRQKLSQLLDCPPEQLALTAGTSWGLLAVAHNRKWQPGDRVLLLEGEFPTNVTPWQRAAEQYELRLEWLPAQSFSGTRGLEDLEQKLRQGLSLVAVSAVQFQTGLRMPIEDMVSLCHAYGAEVCVDLIQAAGVLPLSLSDWGVDYAAGGAHKWLMGCEGAGYLYISPSAARGWQHRWAGWLSHPDPVDFLLAENRLRYDKSINDQAQSLEIGTSSALSQVALEASLDMLLQLGVDNIYQHVQGYLDALEPALIQAGWSSLRHAELRSGSLALRPPQATGNARQWSLLLAEQNIRCSTPDGLLRLSPHWCNSLDEVPQVIQALTNFTAR